MAVDIPHHFHGGGPLLSKPQACRHDDTVGAIFGTWAIAGAADPPHCAVPSDARHRCQQLLHPQLLQRPRHGLPLLAPSQTRTWCF